MYIDSNWLLEITLVYYYYLHLMIDRKKYFFFYNAQSILYNRFSMLNEMFATSCRV